MIVRILGEGQLDVPEAELDGLNELDDKLGAAVESGGEATFRSALGALLGRIRQVGTPLPDDSLEPSDFVLPAPDADLEEVRELFGDQGLVPG